MEMELGGSRIEGTDSGSTDAHSEKEREKGRKTKDKEIQQINEIN